MTEMPAWNNPPSFELAECASFAAPEPTVKIFCIVVRDSPALRRRFHFENLR